MSSTHDLSATGVWGSAVNILKWDDDTGSGRIAGWHSHHWRFEVGDTFILKSRSGTSRYLVEAISRPGDPPDMWFADIASLDRP